MENQNLVQSIRFVLPKKEEGASELAGKMLNFLARLKEIEPSLFPSWYEQAWSKKNAQQKEVLLDNNYLEDIITKEWDKKFPELGSTFILWTGKDHDPDNARISFNIGKTTENVNLKNVVTLSLPATSALQLRDDEKVNEITALIRKVWTPSQIEIE